MVLYNVFKLIHSTMDISVVKLFSLFVFILHCVESLRNDELVCRDENNNIVDWFYIYKLPKNKFSKNDLIKNGVAYMYMTSDTYRQGWTLSTKSINDSHSLPGLTLGPLYEDTDDYLAIVYNDQPLTSKDEDNENGSTTTKKPTKPKLERRKTVRRDVGGQERSGEAKKVKIKRKNSGNGHTKGVVIGDNQHALWLVHSVPKFPPIPDRTIIDKVPYSYPPTAMRYGQSFLCLSLRSSALNDIGYQLVYNEPKILYTKMPAKWKGRFAKVDDVIDNRTVTDAPWFHIANLTTLGNTQFTSFAKGTNFKNDLYSGLVAPRLRSSLLVESWINGAGVLDSNCTSRYKVNNIEKVAFHDKNIAFSSHADHSKWSISIATSGSKNQLRDPNNKWICVGDINRAETQESRGGGTVCTKNSEIWDTYYSVVNEVQPCNRPKTAENEVIAL